MVIAGFDPSLAHFGWVILDVHKTGKESLIDHGTFKTSPSDGIMIQRLIMQRERAIGLIQRYNLSFIAMEAPYWGDFSTEILFALNQFLHEVFLNKDMYVIYIQPMTMKKFAVPSMDPREVTKHHMVHQAKKELNLQGKRFSEHVSDAYFAGKIGCRFYRWFFLKEIERSDLTEEEQHLFCGKHTFVRGVKKGITEYTGLIYREFDQVFDYTKQKRKTAQIVEEIHGS